jgi:hypothetical protein
MECQQKSLSISSGKKGRDHIFNSSCTLLEYKCEGTLSFFDEWTLIVISKWGDNHLLPVFAQRKEGN